MKHTLVMIVANEKGNPSSLKEKIKILKEIRHTELAEETFAQSNIRLINSRIRWAVMLLKYRIYVILAIVLS